ncbi:MAG: hypothetical protein L6R41_008496 [Letrouitia leprolyta]|nr:MAG: hypothetical protein L6R41_008496 [Letrouitia leprolyta]
MTVLLGKRKRRQPIADLERHGHPTQDSSDNNHLQNILQRHFETKFEPLENPTRGSTQEAVLIEEFPSDTYGTDWSGFSEDDERENALIVKYENHKNHKADVSRQDLKYFMVLHSTYQGSFCLSLAKLCQSTKPPLQFREPPFTAKRTKSESPNPDEVATDAANLKKDLALQRLLEESHLLDPSSSLTPSGQRRHKALDIRQQALGSKSSTFTQKSMPIAQRKGILAKAAERDESRRREAKDNGIILEKATKAKGQDPKRQREIGTPRIGKFTRGMLTLSKKDVYEIVGRSKKAKRR